MKTMKSVRLWLIAGFLLSCGQSKPVSSVILTGHTAQYHLTINEVMQSIGGQQVLGYSINEQQPGPVLVAEIGDILEVTVFNDTTTDTVIHWHGVLVPNDQDGVAGVTGPAISAGERFTYRFPVVQTGTYWYHAHGLEEAQGLFGGIIFTASGDVAEVDNMLLFSGQLNRTPEAVLLELNPNAHELSGHATHARVQHVMDHSHAIHHNMSYSQPNTHHHAMSHSHHMTHFSDVEYYAHLVNATPTPIPIVVEPGQTSVMLRLVNAYVDGFLNLVYSGGDITVIASDGLPITHVATPNLRMAMGETFDIILPVSSDTQHELVAFFLGSDEYSRVIIGSSGDLVSLSSYAWEEYPLDQMYHRMETHRPNFIHWNNKAAKHKFDLQLLGDHDAYNWRFEQNGAVIDYAEVPVGAKIRVAMHNDTMMPHPIHLHGHFFKVTSVTQQLFQHTVNLDPAERIEIEFITDSEGLWLFHCHNLFHMASGMTLTFHVVT